MIIRETIVILDFGSQYTQLIARRVREAKVYSLILPFDTDMASIQALAPKGIILSGGPESILMPGAPQIPSGIFDLGCPILGICYGMQALTQQLGGKVEKALKHEYGYAQIKIVAPNALLEGISDNALLDVWMSHGDHITELPHGFEMIAKSEGAVAAIALEEKQLYGVQFHPEVTHTKHGMLMIQNFVHHICGCQSLWTFENIIEEQIQAIQEEVGDKHVVLGLSGGVDSSVVAAMLHRAIGDQLTCLFVDTGLLRLDEATEVMKATQSLNIKVIQIDAGDEFIHALAGESCPEAKRKIIGGKFIEIFEREAKKIPGVEFLAQGTIYPDVIESNGGKTGKAKVIKSHHNVGGLPEVMNLKLIEPLRELFKDEVRNLGLTLGLSQSLIFRHPFPGPGLGVRILGEIKPQYVPILQQADHIFLTALRRANFYDKTAQAFAVFLPVKSVGVTGDARRYEYVIALRAVETTDFMTANVARLPFELLEEVSTQIINEIPQVSRVTYDISSKPPATIEWE